MTVKDQSIGVSLCDKLLTRGHVMRKVPCTCSSIVDWLQSPRMTEGCNPQFAAWQCPSFFFRVLHRGRQVETCARIRACIHTRAMLLLRVIAIPLESRGARLIVKQSFSIEFFIISGNRALYPFLKYSRDFYNKSVNYFLYLTFPAGMQEGER